MCWVCPFPELEKFKVYVACKFISVSALPPQPTVKEDLLFSQIVYVLCCCGFGCGGERRIF